MDQVHAKADRTGEVMTARRKVSNGKQLTYISNSIVYGKKEALPLENSRQSANLALTWAYNGLTKDWMHGSRS